MSYMAAQSLLLALVKTMPQFQDTYAASTISFDQATGKILDSSGGLAWLEAGDLLTVAGSTSNDGTYTVTSSAAGEVVVTEALIDELAGDSVTLTRPANATEGDYRIIDSGRTNLAVITPGQMPEYDTASMTRTQRHEAVIDLFTRFIDFTAFNSFGTLRDALVAAINGAPCMSDTYFITGVQSDGGLDVYDNVITQRLRVAIEEQV